MTAITVVDKVYSNQSTPGQEVVVAQVTDGYTYTATTLSKVRAGLICLNVDAGDTVTTTPSVVPNSTTKNLVTINWNLLPAATTAVLVLYGE